MKFLLDRNARSGLRRLDDSGVDWNPDLFEVGAEKGDDHIAAQSSVVRFGSDQNGDRDALAGRKALVGKGSRQFRSCDLWFLQKNVIFPAIGKYGLRFGCGFRHQITKADPARVLSDLFLYNPAHMELDYTPDRVVAVEVNGLDHRAIEAGCVESALDFSALSRFQYAGGKEGRGTAAGVANFFDDQRGVSGIVEFESMSHLFSRKYPGKIVLRVVHDQFGFLRLGGCRVGN